MPQDVIGIQLEAAAQCHFGQVTAGALQVDIGVILDNKNAIVGLQFLKHNAEFAGLVTGQLEFLNHCDPAFLQLCRQR